MESPTDPECAQITRSKYGTIQRIISIWNRIMVFAIITTLYIMGYQILQKDTVLFSLGIYGASVILHLLIQSLFAYLELNTHSKYELPCSFTKTVGLVIAGYQEDPNYLRQCLESCRTVKYPKDKLKVIFVIDGNTDEDVYMMDMFKEVFHEEDVGTFVWSENYHTIKTPEDAKDGSSSEESKPLKDNEEIKLMEELVRTKRCVCIMQKWGGKREVMYTAFRAVGNTVDYVQVCDSDTKLDEMATVEMVKVLEADEKCGAVGGDVRILNVYDSFVSYMSSLRYWVAFNIERACQSYFDCVSCISGPLGMYRNSILQAILDPWHSQKFLGSYCTMGDDRHLTNRILSVGYKTNYTNKSRAYTKEPSQFIGWWNQQNKLVQSYPRMWFCNARWWHKTTYG
ncbi:hypothetical protein GDO86_004947 [Hymenochirus boettgeri]|uniref:Hyaluronan synthase n=1 Tax=Hymenochirus boettgeri TaxID=247094 RepID=A0A8T2J471_9PIPI|nr:hypothetical protein GDO86_004947 [Hymenochirus boettgeri]